MDASECALIAAEPGTSMSADISLAQHFIDVTPLTEVSVDTSHMNTHTPVLHSTQATLSSSSLSKYLVLSHVPTPSGRRGEPPRARLLTSAAALELQQKKARSRAEREKEEREGRNEEKRAKEKIRGADGAESQGESSE